MSVEDPLLKFLNTEFGLLISAFFFTTLAGGILTTWYKLISKKQEIRFTQLHEDRARAIKTFHDKIVEVTKLFEDIDDYILSKPFAPETLPSFKEIDQILKEFNAFSERNKIYFSKEFGDTIDANCKVYAIYLTGIQQFNQSRTEQFLELLEVRAETTNKVNEVLRHEFRNLLGVE